ncbi:hypothetical protein JT358_13570 [Micrococcales bacterium 31B]|nr:hypothetical protein [Micrococcales bacterium 31B]
MPRPREAACVEGSGHELQDTWGERGATLWVIDGATATDPANNPAVAAWVGTLSRALALAVEADPEHTLAATLELAIARSREPGTGWHPSATVAMARWHANGLSTLVLCDAGLLIRQASGVCAVTQDTRLDDVLAAPRAALAAPRAALAEARASHDEARTARAFASLVREVDDLRNREGGFWVAARDPDAAHHALTAEHPDAAGVIAMSDGVCNEIGRVFGGPVAAWDALSAGLAASVARLRGEVLARDGGVDDLTAVVSRRPG